MSKRILITFGGVAYDEQVARQRGFCKDVALAAGIVGNVEPIEHRVYDDAWLMTTPFYRLNKWIFDREPQHGFGFCSWKPYIIKHALAHYCQPGDVVLYLDGDSFPVADISCLFEYAEREGIMLFEEQGCINRQWTKADCFHAMGCLNQPHYYDAPQACGRFSLYRAGDYRVEQFLAEWQTYSLNPSCTFHEKSSVLGVLDDPTLFKNSCEQSVLGNLAVKYGIPTHRTPDQNGWPVHNNGTYKPEDAYPQLFCQQWRSGNILDRTGSKYRNV
jgi:hypothetical protein